METNAPMMEAVAVHVKSVDLNQKPSSTDHLALGYLNRRPWLSRVKVEVDMMGVLVEAMRRGQCYDEVKVLEMSKAGPHWGDLPDNDDGDDDAGVERVVP